MFVFRRQRAGRLRVGERVPLFGWPAWDSGQDWGPRSIYYIYSSQIRTRVTYLN